MASIYRNSGSQGAAEFKADPGQIYYAEVNARITEDYREGDDKSAFRGRLKIEAWDICSSR